MTRELIIECMVCKEECQEENSCFECADKQLTEYEKQIRAEFANKLLDTLCNGYHYPTQSFANGVIEVVKDAIHDIEQMREQKNE